MGEGDKGEKSYAKRVGDSTDADEDTGNPDRESWEVAIEGAGAMGGSLEEKSDGVLKRDRALGDAGAEAEEVGDEKEKKKSSIIFLQSIGGMKFLGTEEGQGGEASATSPGAMKQPVIIRPG